MHYGIVMAVCTSTWVNQIVLILHVINIIDIALDMFFFSSFFVILIAYNKFRTKYTILRHFFLLSNFVAMFKLNKGLRAQAVIEFNQQDVFSV